MNKTILVIGIIFLLIGVSVLSSVSSKDISVYNEKIGESELQMKLDSHLSAYGLDMRDTMDEFKQVLNNLVSKSK